MEYVWWEAHLGGVLGSLDFADPERQFITAELDGFGALVRLVVHAPQGQGGFERQQRALELEQPLASVLPRRRQEKAGGRQ